MRRLKENINYIKTFLFLFISIFILSVVILNGSKKTYVTYNEFLNYIDSGNVKEVVLSNSKSFNFILKDEKICYTDNPRKENLKEELLLKDVVVKEGNDNNSIIFLLFMCIGYLIIYKYSKGKVKAKETGINFKDVNETMWTKRLYVVFNTQCQKNWLST